MSTWGPGSFENDEAMDWVAELESYTDDSPIIDALNTVIDQADDYPEAPECSVAIAAAEVVAAMIGEPSEDCPEEVGGGATSSLSYDDGQRSICH